MLATSADINHRHPVQRDGLKVWGDWITQNVGYSGYRFDYTQGIEPWFISEFMRGPLKKDRFAVMEYWTENSDATSQEYLTWLDLTDNTACLFDMLLHTNLAMMCNSDTNFNMSSLASDTLVWTQPNRAVTFVESHDTIRPKGEGGKEGIKQDKMLAYAFILIAEGIPMIAYNDYLLGTYASSDLPIDWFGPSLKVEIDRFIDIRREHVAGSMKTLLSDHPSNLLLLKRSGNTKKSGCILVLNNHPSSLLSSSVQTGWISKVLQDVISQQSVVTDTNGIAILSAPSRGYSVYVPVIDSL